MEGETRTLTEAYDSPEDELETLIERMHILHKGMADLEISYAESVHKIKALSNLQQKISDAMRHQQLQCQNTALRIAQLKEMVGENG